MKKGKKILKIISIILKTIIGIALAAFILVVCLQRFSDNKLSLFNHRLFSVVSQSMVPVYDIGDVILVKQRDENKIKVGDDVLYNASVKTIIDAAKLPAGDYTALLNSS